MGKKRMSSIGIFVLLFLSGCSVFRNNAGTDDNMATGSAVSGGVVSSAAVSGTAVSGTAVSGQAIGEKKEKGQKAQKVTIVTDETGKKRELRLGDVDVEDAGVYFSEAYWVTDYSQVIDGHYYYLRYEGAKDGDYIIYRDKGEKVGGFNLFEEETFYDYTYYDVDGFAKYGENFYILYSDGEDDTREDSEAKEELYDAGLGYIWPIKLARIDLEKKKVDVICDVTSAHPMQDDNLIFCNIYKNAFYFDRRSVKDACSFLPGNSVKYTPSGNGSGEESVPMSANAAKAKPYLTYMDGKVYYGVAEGKKVTLYSSDLESGEEQEIFQYERKQEYETDVIYLDIDEDYIYCQDYLIPRSGGKMVRALKNAKMKNGEASEMPNKKYSVMYYSHNQKYIFYIGKDKKVHRISKKTKEDIVISDLKAVGVDCTEDNVYVRVRSKAWYDDENWDAYNDDDEGWESPDFYSDDLYCMDLNGKNVEKIWKGRWM